MKSVIGLQGVISERVSIISNCLQIASEGKWERFVGSQQQIRVEGECLFSFDTLQWLRGEDCIIRYNNKYFYGLVTDISVESEGIARILYSVISTKPLYFVIDYDLVRQYGGRTDIIVDYSGNNNNAHFYTYNHTIASNYFREYGFEFTSNIIAECFSKPLLSEFTILADFDLFGNSTNYAISVCSKQYPYYTPFLLNITQATNNGDYQCKSFAKKDTRGIYYLKRNLQTPIYFTDSSLNGQQIISGGIADNTNTICFNDYRRGRNIRSNWILKRWILIDRNLGDRLAQNLVRLIFE